MPIQFVSTATTSRVIADFQSLDEETVRQLCEDWDIPPNEPFAKHKDFLSELFITMNSGFRDMILNQVEKHDPDSGVENVKDYVFYDKGEVHCPICRDEHDNVAIISCGHTYCADCINQWIGIKSTCPMCRTVVKKLESQDPI